MIVNEIVKDRFRNMILEGRWWFFSSLLVNIISFHVLLFNNDCEALLLTFSHIRLELDFYLPLLFFLLEKKLKIWHTLKLFLLLDVFHRVSFLWLFSVMSHLFVYLFAKILMSLWKYYVCSYIKTPKLLFLFSVCGV